jgi:lysophospholipase L1-like esterase
MAKVIHKIKVEVAKPNFFQAIVAKQFDNGSRFLNVTFVNGEEKIEIAKGSTVTINATRSDGGEKKFAGSVNSDGTATVPLAYWMLELEGKVKSDISVTDTSGNTLTSTKFNIEVEKASCGDSGVSEDDEEVDVLISLIKEVQNVKENYDVEQTYDPNSTKAQSGIAVAQAMENVEIEVDDEMSDTSTNPVQNKVSKAYTDAEVQKVAEEVSKVAEEIGKVDDIIDPMLIQGAIAENYYNPDTADIVVGKYINAVNGNADSNTAYMYFKVKLYSGKKYRINLANTYSVVVFDNGEINGRKVYSFQPNTTQAFELPEMEERIVTAYITCNKSEYTKVKENVIIVEGEKLPTGDEQYRISYPWLYVPEEEKELEIPPYTVNEIALKQKMPPHLFDGIEMDNYFDVEYMVANSTEDAKNKKYANTPYVYLPSGTYTISECYSYTLMSKDGEKGETIRTKTFTLTEEYPYISFMILCQVGGVYDVNYLRKISIQKGETATAYAPNTYRFSDKFNFKGSVGYYPTHWDSKKYVAIGDSITFGYAPNGNSEGLAVGQQVSTYYSKIVSENLNMELLNVGQSGANVKSALGLQQPTYNHQVQQAIDFNADVVTIMLGVNDSGASTSAQYVPLGTIDDVYDESNITFYSGLSEIVRQIQTALPSATIILLSSPKNNFTVNEIKQNYFKAVKDVAEKYDVLFCDLHNGCGFNINNPVCVSEFVLSDVHPDVKAHKILGSRLTGFIASH